MRNKVLIVLVGLASFLVFPTILVSAHILKSDGSIGAVVHIDPEDDPIVGEVSSFFFDFKDSESRFQPKNCNCIFSISKGGGEIFSTDLFLTNDDPNLTNASTFFTFPEKGVYQLKVVGEPKTEGSFQSFVLTYDIRVDRETYAGSNRPFQNFLKPQNIVLGLVILFVVVVVAYNMRKTSEDSSKRTKGGEKNEKDFGNYR